MRILATAIVLAAMATAPAWAQSGYGSGSESGSGTGGDSRTMAPAERMRGHDGTQAEQSRGPGDCLPNDSRPACQQAQAPEYPEGLGRGIGGKDGGGDGGGSGS